MPRSRVLSFMSQWGGGPRSPTTEGPPSSPRAAASNFGDGQFSKPAPLDTATSQRVNVPGPESPKSPSTPSRARGDSRVGTRPNSMIQTYQPPQVEVAHDTPPELQPIFSYLNSHSNKLYQEGYFLKLHDLDTRGRPSQDRVWVECFAQLAGTVLSLWDAAALDAAGEDGEVVPTFINLSDATIKMIESLPMNGAKGGSLQNVLSVSTAANNRYLLHFNSLSSLTQWAAGIRLSMFENATLQEAYTGSLIAGKGRFLNNIKSIMERSRFAHEDWVRVRFGAGTPWKRYWCVISPPDEKEYNKAQKEQKKASAYERVKIPKGDIKFYDTRKITKKTRPIATISDAYAAYAIYPQSKPLIDQSTLVKLEGLVTIHTSPESTNEGFTFIMPEVHPAVSGFEMMLRFLFPVFDTFCLYGRPTRLIADSLDQRGLMFAMPRDRRYGYLDTLDVSSLIHTKGSQAWSERQWRREMKKLTGERMLNQGDASPRSSRQLTMRRATTSRAPGLQAGGVRFNDEASVHSSPGSRTASPAGYNGTEGAQFGPPARTDSAPPGNGPRSPHKRSVSEAIGFKRHQVETPSRLSQDSYRPTDDDDLPPAPPRHGGTRAYGPGSLERINSGAEIPTLAQNTAATQDLPPPAPVGSPPPLQHKAHSRPTNQPAVPPELRRAHSDVDRETLQQMQDVARPVEQDEWSGDMDQRQRNMVDTNTPGNRKLEVPTDASQGLVNYTAANDGPRRQVPRPNTIEILVDSYANPATQRLRSLDSLHSGRHSPRNEATAAGQPVTAFQQQSSSVQPSSSVLRKPVPRGLPQPPTVTQPDSDGDHPSESPVSSVLHENWEGGVIDESALDRILEQDSRNNTMASAASSATPDYASTVSSKHEPLPPQEKPRAGKLKTTGDPDYRPANLVPGGAGRLDTYAAERSEHSSDVPTIDFGPTYTYKPTGRPGTGGTITPGNGQEDRSRSQSRDRLRNSSRDRLSVHDGLNNVSPNENKRNSYFGGRQTPSPTAGLETAGRRNSVAWQPVAASPGHVHARGASLTPDQWVHQRAALASQPQHPPPRKPVSPSPHGRQSSASNYSDLNLRRATSKTPPPFSRSPSGDWTQGQTTPPSRPHSRNASVHLNQYNASVAQPTSLSAQEQMQIARATGTPMLNNYTTGAQRKESEQHAPGLFGALAAREKEKEHSKHRNSMAVQQAIAVRQQQQAVQMEQDYAAAAARQAHQQMYMQQQITQQQMQQAQQQQMFLAHNQAQQRQSGVTHPNWQQPRPPQQPINRSQSPSMYRAPTNLPNYGSAPNQPGPAQMQWERQQAMMAQQPGGAQQWQQQQGRP